MLLRCKLLYDFNRDFLLALRKASAWWDLSDNSSIPKQMAPAAPGSSRLLRSDPFPTPCSAHSSSQHHHIYFLQLRTLTNSSRQQRPVYLYFSWYIFSRMAVTIIETIKKLALTLNKCAHMSGSPRKENLWDRCWIQGRKKSWIALAGDAAQDAAANIWFNSLCSFRTRI